MKTTLSAILLSMAAIATAPIAEALPLPSNHMFPVDASYTYSGSSGNWLVDFTFTNNFTQAGHWSLYFAGIRLGATDIANAPSGFNTNIGTYDAATLNGGTAPVMATPLVYNNNWFNPQENTLLPGDSLGGFRATSHATDAPIEVSWLVFVDNFEAPYAGDDYIYRIGNPGFQGVARGVSTNPAADPNTVPEPGTMSLVVVALGLTGLIARRRARAAAGS